MTDILKLIETGRRKEAMAFIRAGGDVNMSYRSGKTPLMVAADRGDLDLCRLLVKHGANLYAKTTDGLTALFYATSNYPTFEWYVRSVRKIDKLSGELSLYWTACDNKTPMVIELLRLGVSPNVTDHEQMTPLFFAVAHNNLRMTLALLHAGANVNATDNQYHTPIFGAINRNHDALLSLLISKGANVNADMGGWHTPLFYAIEEQNVSAVKLLLQHGAIINDLHKTEAIVVGNKSILAILNKSQI